MASQDTSGYIRVFHTGASKRSIYLKDIDGEINRGNDRQKSPCYVPYQGSIDILLTDRTLASYEQGDIRGFIRKGYVRAYIVRALRSGSYEEITYDETGKPTSSIMWTDQSRTSKIEERQWGYSGNDVISEIIHQYDRDGAISLSTQTLFDRDISGRIVSSKEDII